MHHRIRLGWCLGREVTSPIEECLQRLRRGAEVEGQPIPLGGNERGGSKFRGLVLR